MLPLHYSDLSFGWFSNVSAGQRPHVTQRRDGRIKGLNEGRKVNADTLGTNRKKEKKKNGHTGRSLAAN